MKLKSLGANRTQVKFNNGAIVFFSYSTPVAAQRAGGGFIRTDQKYSVTTSKHINQWLGGARAESVPQSELDSLVG